MFIRKKDYEALLDEFDDVRRERDRLAREVETMKERKKVHDAGPICHGCKNLIEEKHLYGTFYHCKLDRGCKMYTEE